MQNGWWGYTVLCYCIKYIMKTENAAAVCGCVYL